MNEEHPNIAILKRFDPTNVAGTINVFAENVVFRYFNALLPDLHGDYVGHAGIQTFFEKLGQLTGTAFEANVVSVTPFGDELLVVHRKQEITVDQQRIESDVVVVWRIVDGKIAEAWDIPSIHVADVSPVK